MVDGRTFQGIADLQSVIEDFIAQNDRPWVVEQNRHRSIVQTQLASGRVGGRSVIPNLVSSEPGRATGQSNSTEQHQKGIGRLLPPVRDGDR